MLKCLLLSEMNVIMSIIIGIWCAKFFIGSKSVVYRFESSPVSRPEQNHLEDKSTNSF